MFNQTYGLQQAVVEERKPITRREPYFGEVKNPNTRFLTEGKDCGRLALCDGGRIVAKSRYAVGEVVAIAQAYKDIKEFNTEEYDDVMLDHGIICEAGHPYANLRRSGGWNNKMFVKAELMPKRIKITNIRYERLQDISDEDCLKEGVLKYRCMFGFAGEYVIKVNNKPLFFHTPRKAFAVLIDKVSGKGTWSKNPWVVVYAFEVLK